ncbi:tRNA (N6-isopentenyl adenosine(37)-C2)-methylthiotransferase MiaB [Lishizhenia sp.]|uniref:tRNA (N6-isopentenyl adenosine(37)-C2)-methylthiotransferase MiaB n=1 Tax=Lishizhenia sp. TaxID=2497594 RepID=UPI00299F4B3A|nr:tRNA (N6-isopentenyl adenosine(37)-C2)-methylthiotransferase MiaB [Lishizhenia sp.]MDX1446865.1 tRNA (N6-isopentenyl adenosine(37)-C2)-methylthiotransferase MiaB [Lishizhenia sp.]
MMDNILEGKKIDENRQGEALEMASSSNPNGKKLFLESYGCAMNFSDSEVVASILIKQGYQTTNDETEADLILINTCSIRENAEERVRKRLTNFKYRKQHQPSLIVGVLGCMAERLKKQLLEEEKLVDIVAGPDSYRDLPSLINEVEGGQKAVNVLLSREETYADISPVRLDNKGISSFVSITRGCDNMCSFCVVPFTRGRERSRDPQTIVQECRDLFEQGYREVTLLGQNVDSYRWNITNKGEIKDETKPTTNFAELMAMCAEVHPDLRIRFSTSHPKDMTDEVLETIAKYDNICNYIHLPVQSGNTEVLKKMNRGYSREWYLNRIDAIKRIVPEAAISTDIITGFCGETEEQHRDTLSLIEEVKFDFAYMYKYSERPKTLAERKYEDDIPEEVKQRRLTEIITLQREQGNAINQSYVGKTVKVLVEGNSKKSEEMLCGRNDQNTMVVFPKIDVQPASYVDVKITDCTSATLIGEAIA